MADNYSQTRRSLSWVSFGGAGQHKALLYLAPVGPPGSCVPWQRGSRGRCGGDGTYGAMGTCCPASCLPAARLLARAAGDGGLGAGRAERRFLSGLWRGGFPLRHTEMSVMVCFFFAPFRFRDFSSHPTKLPVFPSHSRTTPQPFSIVSTRNPVTTV